MQQTKIIARMGADDRLRAAGRALADMGYTVQGPEGAAGAGCLLFGLPLGADSPGLAQALAGASPGAAILAGRVSPGAHALAAGLGRRIVDYYDSPTLAEYNAIPTAEGTIALLLAHSDVTLWRRPVLVVGFGRTGRALAVRLTALGALVTVAARSPAQRAQAESLGCAAVPLAALAGAAAGFAALVNTVPALVVSRPVLAALAPGSLVIDLASRPGGVDLAAAAGLGHNAIHALGLPGKYAPVSAGQFIAAAVHNILQGEGETR